MGYDIRIVDANTKEPITLKNKHDIKGGTYCVGGTKDAWISITFNYAKWFYEIWPQPESEKKDDTTPFGQMFGSNNGGIRSLYGKPLNVVVSELDKAVNTLQGDPSQDYWEACEGNARNALFKLKMLCEKALYDYPKLEMTLSGD